MKRLSSLIFLVIICLISYLIYLVVNQDLTDNHQIGYDFNDEKIFHSAIDSISRVQPMIDTTSVNIPVYSAQVEDFEANAVLKPGYVALQIFKSHQLIFEKKIQDFNIKNLMCSDLNNNQQPEFWIFGDDKANKFKIYGFEFHENSFNLINFPNLMGRQKFGYSGMDSLYFIKSDIVHSFKFKNDPYAEFENGIRICYYSLGPDNSFILKKTVDFENE